MIINNNNVITSITCTNVYSTCVCVYTERDQKVSCSLKMVSTIVTPLREKNWERERKKEGESEGGEKGDRKRQTIRDLGTWV